MMHMNIGITEYGDAGIDFRWEQKLHTVDGAVLITKNLNTTFIQKVLESMQQHKIIVHCTCTGWGGTIIEPNVPDFKTQLNHLKELILAGFPAKQIVLRIDPIFPSEAGLQRVKDVLDYYHSLNLPEDEIRLRMSLIDEYPHVRERYAKNGLQPLYGGRFYPSYEQINAVGNLLSSYPYTFCTCAEDKLADKFPNTFEIAGCISKTDLEILGIAYDANLYTNPQNRNMCHCLSCKTELLKPRKKCPHGCLYCFWKD